MKSFNYLQSRWTNIEQEKNKNMQKAGFVLITRKVSSSGLRRGKGQMVTAISVKPEQLPKNIQAIAKTILLLSNMPKEKEIRINEDTIGIDGYKKGYNRAIKEIKKSIIR